MKIVTVGGATQDIFLHYEDGQTIEIESKFEKKSFLLLQEGSKIEIKQLSYCIGGGATNTAVSFRRLGFEVASFFKVGADDQGALILKSLEKEGIDVSYCLIDDTAQTGVSYIIPSHTGDRTILAYRGANAALKKEEIPETLFDKSSLLYITSLSGRSSHILLPLCQEAKKKGLLVATNPGTSQLMAGAQDIRRSLPSIDIFILNRDEAALLLMSILESEENVPTQLKQKVASQEKLPSLLQYLCTYKEYCFNVVHFFQTISSFGPKTIVVTNGAEGVYVFCGGIIYFHPSVPIKPVSTVGAGDAFGSAFVAGLLKYDSIEYAIRAGILNSVSVITHSDAKEGLLTAQQLEKEMSRLDKDLLQIFK